MTKVIWEGSEPQQFPSINVLLYPGENDIPDDAAQKLLSTGTVRLPEARAAKAKSKE